MKSVTSNRINLFESYQNGKNERLNKLLRTYRSQKQNFSELNSFRKIELGDLEFSKNELLAAFERSDSLNNQIKNEVRCYLKKQENPFESLVVKKSENSQKSYISHLLSILEVIFDTTVFARRRNVSGEFELLDGFGLLDEPVFPFFIEEAVDELISELQTRRMINILKNVLSSTVNTFTLKFSQLPIRLVTYKYYDLIFTLKKEIEVGHKLLNNLFYENLKINTNDIKLFRPIQIACRA